MSIINQALQKAQSEQLRHQQQESLYRFPAAPVRRPWRSWWITGGALLAFVALGGALRAWWLPPPATLSPGLAVRPSAVNPEPPPARPVVVSPPVLGSPESSGPAVVLEGTRPAVVPSALLTEGIPIRTALTPAALQAPQPPPEPVMPSLPPKSPPPSDVARAQMLLQRATAAQEAGELTQAAAWLEQAVKLDPTAKATYNNLGNVYYQQRRYPQALAMYHKALGLDPAYVKARINLGSTYMQLFMDAEAIEALQTAIRMDATASLAHYNLACVHARSGNSALAAQSLQQAIALEPQARTWARTDADFTRVRTAPAVQALLGP